MNKLCLNHKPTKRKIDGILCEPRTLQNSDFYSAAWIKGNIPEFPEENYRCSTCGHQIIMTQPEFTMTNDPESTAEPADYWWYCSNPACNNHHPGEQLFNDECPQWVVFKESKHCLPLINTPTSIPKVKPPKPGNTA